ncbi:Gfo/Idh/MocA family protein [Paenibacillus sp. MMS18-CY102]|uniref:Gfo/Idh/MocA family protein n=1 Tax=Paenibacillus sp. MMS18-CY102 TaxID=2682849 RepID=UPI00136525AE|nr:Gfo/Idh/MocA family oxidoreductase [Paenibacillus sp. MMS18-CY102]MWC30228.1 gfo/Idh/MocA family oxidoreductase [Paenibacillus sp. MMS18-CY102]
MNKINLAVIGLGNMGLDMIRHMIPSYANDMNLVAVCDSNESQFETIVGAHPEARCFTDYRELLNEVDVDLVYIAVPPAMHYEVALSAISKNMHVFCEKPLANSLAEAKHLLEMAAEREIVHAVHFSFPLEPAVLMLRKLMAEQCVGQVTGMELILEFPQWPRPWQQNRWVSTRQEGGFILEVGIHWIQMIQQVFGSITHVQSAVTFPAGTGSCENEVAALLTLDNHVSIRVSGTVNGGSQERVSLIVHGTEGTIALENWEQLLLNGANVELPDEIMQASASRLPILNNVIQLLNGRQGFVYDFYDGYNAQVILEALRYPSEAGAVDVRLQHISRPQ